MKLLTHNLLQCPLSGTYPLKIEATTVERNESEYRADVVLNMLPKLEWSVLLEAAAAVGFEGMPETPPPNPSEDDAFLRLLHSCILDVHVVEGSLVSSMGRRYPIADCIPNLLLQEGEVNEVAGGAQARRAAEVAAAHAAAEAEEAAEEAASEPAAEAAAAAAAAADMVTDA